MGWDSGQQHGASAESFVQAHRVGTTKIQTPAGRLSKAHLFALCLATIACDTHAVTRKRCTELRDHVVDLRLVAVRNIKPAPMHFGPHQQPMPSPPAIDVEGHRLALKQALGESYVDSCLKTLTPDQLKCALAARDSESVTNCISTSK